MASPTRPNFLRHRLCAAPPVHHLDRPAARSPSTVTNSTSPPPHHEHRHDPDSGRRLPRHPPKVERKECGPPDAPPPRRTPCPDPAAERKVDRRLQPPRRRTEPRPPCRPQGCAARHSPDVWAAATPVTAIPGAKPAPGDHQASREQSTPYPTAPTSTPRPPTPKPERA